MRNILACVFTGALLLGCGGGDGGSDGCSGGTANCLPNDSKSTGNTGLASGATASETQGTTLCGVDVGNKLLEGLVTQVHDGDTVTLGSAASAYQIRLDSIDAPELAQPFGSLSQAALAKAVLGKSVKVAYSKTDQYGRIVGAVFTDSCQYVNLDQVAVGLAWFYKAYQCEISEAARNQFMQAQNKAVQEKAGLWAQTDPEAPWFYRNGSEPVTPVCTRGVSVWSANSALTSVGPTTPANSAGNIGSAASPQTCYTGPRGGTYTLTASGSKNYGGC
ncbi:thermonuclease family protein [Polaromonas sp. CG_9.11]|uniref:thermonuclease family protein n=1 Tax=Polaromonas sp. CG_9.11 TaxID=2787730 RepID=UPI0018CAFBED|nr:thermonuclease family protein [Polaromonas sp. CG_9.11]MBG6075269.1 endonuclease YncB(thermonuclease family) [Polaromonas sp. CG_9.11]